MKVSTCRGTTTILRAKRWNAKPFSRAFDDPHGSGTDYFWHRASEAVGAGEDSELTRWVRVEVTSGLEVLAILDPSRSSRHA